MGAGGNIEISNSIFSEINTGLLGVRAGAVSIIGTSTSSHIFENNIFENIVSDKSTILLTGISNGVNISNNTFSIISSNSSGGVYYLFYLILYIFILL
jgi:hypothetical protein